MSVSKENLRVIQTRMGLGGWVADISAWMAISLLSYASETRLCCCSLQMSAQSPENPAVNDLDRDEANILVLLKLMKHSAQEGQELYLGTVRTTA